MSLPHFLQFFVHNSICELQNGHRKNCLNTIRNIQVAPAKSTNNIVNVKFFPLTILNAKMKITYNKKSDFINLFVVDKFSFIFIIIPYKVNRVHIMNSIHEIKYRHYNLMQPY